MSTVNEDHTQLINYLIIILDDSKKFSILKRGIGIESEKVSKQVLEIKKVWK